MSNKSDYDNGLVRVKEHIPYFGRGIDELIAALRKLFSDNKYPQRIVLEAGVKHIYLEKLVTVEEAKENESLGSLQLSIHDGIRNSKLEEYEIEGDLTPFQQLFDMFGMVQAEGLEVCQIAVGDKSKFQKWLGVRIPQTNLSILGTPVIVTGEIPHDTFVVCGGPTRTSDPYEIRYSVKGAL